MVSWFEILCRANAVVGHVAQHFHRGAIVVVLEQDIERVVLVLVPVLCLDLFNESGEN